MEKSGIFEFMSFESLGLLPELLRAVQEKGYEVPTSIQAQAIPTILQGRDVLFATDRAELNANGMTTVRKLAEIMMQNPDRTVMVETNVVGETS